MERLSDTGIYSIYNLRQLIVKASMKAAPSRDVWKCKFDGVDACSRVRVIDCIFGRVTQLEALFSLSPFSIVVFIRTARPRDGFRDF